MNSYGSRMVLGMGGGKVPAGCWAPMSGGRVHGGHWVPLKPWGVLNSSWVCVEHMGSPTGV